MRHKTGKFTKGFTIVEMMVVVGIVVLFTAFTMNSINQSKEEKAVEAAMREVAAVVREAQNAALTGGIVSESGLAQQQYPCFFTLECTDCGAAGAKKSYQIRYEPHTLDALCPPVNTSPRVYRTYALNNQIKFNATFSIVFSVPHGDTSARTEIIVEKGGFKRYVCVSALGMVRESNTECFPP